MVIALPNKTIIQKTTLVTHSELLSLPTRELQLKVLHRRFVRLSTFFPKRKFSIIYLSLLKSRFTKPDDFNFRYQKILSTASSLSEDELLKRSIKTLELVSKAMTFQDQFISDIIMNIIRVEETKEMFVTRNRGNERKIDYYIEGLEYHDTDEGADKKTKELRRKLIGLKEFDIALMRLNESLGLCL